MSTTTRAWQVIKNLKEIPGQSLKIVPYLKRYKLWVATTVIFIVFRQSALLAEPAIYRELIATYERLAEFTLTRDEALTRTLWLMAGFAAVHLFSLGSIAMLFRSLNRFQSYIMRDAANDFVDKVLNLSFRFHTNRKTGKLSKEFARGVSALETFTDAAVFSVIPLTIYLGSILVIFTTIDKWLTVILLGLVITFCSFSIWTSFIMQKRRKVANEMDDESNRKAMDAVMNAEVVKFFRQEREEVRQFRSLRAQWRDKKQYEWDGWIGILSGQIGIIVLFMGLMIAVTIQKILAGDLQVSDFVMIITYMTYSVGFLWDFQFHFRNVHESTTDIDAFFHYFDQENEIVEQESAPELTVQKGEIRFENVSFAYSEDKQVFENLSFTVPAGSSVAFVGPSGAGKSTIMKLLWRFFDLDSGRILIDGQDIATVTRDSLREQLGIVPQETALFNETVGYNIRYGCNLDVNNPDHDKAMQRAAKLAHADQLIQRLPKGYETLVGERGVKLSGGEKQRIAIARAFLHNAPILVLDEATASLDSRSEAEIQEALTDLMEGRTTLLIAHRLSTIMHADSIIVVDGGKVVQMGTHTELIQQGGLYKQLWEQQVGGYI